MSHIIIELATLREAAHFSKGNRGNCLQLDALGQDITRVFDNQGEQQIDASSCVSYKYYQDDVVYIILLWAATERAASFSHLKHILSTLHPIFTTPSPHTPAQQDTITHTISNVPIKTPTPPPRLAIHHSDFYAGYRP